MTDEMETKVLDFNQKLTDCLYFILTRSDAFHEFLSKNIELDFDELTKDIFDLNEEYRENCTEGDAVDVEGLSICNLIEKLNAPKLGKKKRLPVDCFEALIRAILDSVKLPELKLSVDRHEVYNVDLIIYQICSEVAQHFRQVLYAHV